MKKVFLLRFFEIYNKRLKTNLIKKNNNTRNHGVSVYKKVLKSEYRKSYILQDINYFVKMFVSTLVVLSGLDLG